MAEELLQIRVTADFKEAEGAFLRLAKVATSFEGTIKTIAGNLNKDFNRINGMAELFGDTSNVVKDKMEALKRAMNSLMTSGFQALNPEVQKLKKQYDALAASLTPIPNKLDQAGDSLKKSNQKWTNFALVIQDLPYGFRGIQNNLPALMGGIAGMAGPFYFVGSAIIALFTAWDQGSFKAKNAIDRVSEAHKKSTEGLTKGADAQSAALVEMSKMSVIFSGVKDGLITAEEALEEYNTTYGQTWGIATNVNEAEDSFIKKSNAYVQAMALRAMANEKYAQAQEAFKTGALARGEDQTSFLQKFAAGLSALDQVGIMTFDAASLNKWAKSFSKTYADTQTVLVKDIQNESASSFDKLMAQGREFDKQANKKLKDAGIKPTTGKKGKSSDQIIKEQTAKEKAANDAQTKAYIDTLDERGKKEYQVGLDLANELTVMKSAGFSDSTTYYAAFRANMDKIAKEYDDKEYKRNQDSINANIAAETKFYDDSNRIYDENQKKKEADRKKELDRVFQNEMDAIQNKLSAQLKGNRKEPLQQAQNYNEAIGSLIIMGMKAGTTAEQIEKLQDKINNLNSSAAGTAAAFTPIADILNNLATNTLVEFGTQIGNLLSGGKFALDGFLGMIASALIQIGTHLVMVSKLFIAVDALFASGGKLAFLSIPIGIAAIAAGVALNSVISKKQKVKAFADGGIVSGPTMGLIGEYPGAKSNPEVVAPLDKLKDMLGSNGGGQFILKGQDLVLAMNRSESSLKLRRGI
jgi:hypothetical protein